MTHEEAVEKLKIIKEDYWDDDGYGHESKLYDDTVVALDMAINALKQEHILDKIEKEINSPNRGTCDYFIVDRIEEIINKYKAESEEGAEE